MNDLDDWDYAASRLLKAQAEATRLEAEIERLRGLVTKYEAEMATCESCSEALYEGAKLVPLRTADQPSLRRCPDCDTPMWPAEFNVPCGRCATMKADQLCEWSQDDWEAGTWSAGCGLVWRFEDGGPTENEMKFCPGCGHGLVATPYKDPTDEDEDDVTTDQQKVAP
jgi:Zn finger protein HypA/HybF involved in hydrogenase expression